MGYGKNEEGVTMRTQCDVLKNYLITTGSRISQEECYSLFGFTRLAARMWEIRERIEKNKEPYEIHSRMQHGKNRFGMQCHWKEWWITRKTE